MDRGRTFALNSHVHRLTRTSRPARLSQDLSFMVSGLHEEFTRSALDPATVSDETATTLFRPANLSPGPRVSPYAAFMGSDVRASVVSG